MGYWELKISQHTGYFIYWGKYITGWIIIIISMSRLSNMLYKRVAEEPGCQRAGLLPERYPFFPLWLSLQHYFVTIRLLSRGWCVTSSRVRTVWSPPFFLTLSLSPGITRRSFPAANTEPRTARLSHRAESKGGTEEVFFLSLSLVWSFACQLGAFYFFFFFIFFFLENERAGVFTDSRTGRPGVDGHSCRCQTCNLLSRSTNPLWNTCITSTIMDYRTLFTSRKSI